MNSVPQQTADDIINWAQGRPSEGSFLRGSMAIVAYDTDTLNLLLTRLQESQHDWPEKVINGIDTITPGQTWRAVSSTLGRGRLIVDKTTLADTILTIREPITWRMETELSRSDGHPLRTPFKITILPSGGQYLNTEYYAAENSAILAEDGAISLGWGHAPRFFLSDAQGSNRDEEGARGLATHLRHAPDQTFTLKKGRPFAGVKPVNLFIRTHRASADAHQTLVHVAAPDANPTLPDPNGQKYLIVTKNLLIPWRLPYLATTFFSTSQMRASGFSTEGIEYLCDLLAGGMVESFKLAERDTAVRQESVGIYAYSESLLESNTRRRADYAANPVFIVHNEGAGAYKLETFPPTDSAIWELRNPAVGTLLNTDKQWKYVPPAPNASTAYDEGKTNVPCALKASLPELPLSVDTLVCKVGQEPSLCYHTVLHTAPTHFFQADEHQGNLRLSMFYHPRGGGNPVVVDPATIEWTFLVGEGTVDERGVVILSDSAATRLTVLAAIEPDERKWYWCWIVIPAQFSVSELIELYKGS